MIFINITLLGNFWMVLGGFRSSRRLQNTLQIDLDMEGAGLTLANIKKCQYSCFFGISMYQKRTSKPAILSRASPEHLIFSSTFQNDIFVFHSSHLTIWKSENLNYANGEFKTLKMRSFDTLEMTLWKFETLKYLNLWSFEILKSLKLWNFENNLNNFQA